jgi:copper chaperone CopZ
MSRPQQLLPALTALLSSSCCVIQLILNFFSISCAGFAVLTPYRSLLGSITIVLLSYNLYSKGLNNRQTRLSLVISLLLMISPDIVNWMNQSTSINTTAGIIYNYRIHLDGLGCEACANRIRNTLNSADWVYQTRVFFANQTAIVQTIKECSDGIIVEMIKAIDTKYDAQVLDSWVDYTS